MMLLKSLFLHLHTIKAFFLVNVLCGLKYGSFLAPSHTKLKTAMKASKCISLFILTCLLIYALAYILLLVRVGKHDNQKVAMAINNINGDRSLRNDLNLEALTNPFSICTDHRYETHNEGVGVVIVVHNKHPDVITQTVKSVLANSGDITLQIMIVDDHSSFPVKQWGEWKTISSTKPIKVITLEERKGYAYSKGIACKQLRLLNNIDIVVFLEGGSIVNSGWAAPLLHTLRQHETSVVYPAIDIFDDQENFFYQSGNTIAAFDWSLRLSWEDLDALGTHGVHSRFPLVSRQPHSATDPVYSPAAPPCFATRLDFLESIGDFSASSMFSVFGADNIELSLRSWLCANGGIIRQPCSRVALRRKIQKEAALPQDSDHPKHVLVDVFEGIGSETGMHVEDEYTQYEADQDALATAEMWMGGEPYSQFVLNSRMGGAGLASGRFPYDVKQKADSRHPQHLSDAKAFSEVFDHNGCKRFAWFLHEVYPGLQLDLPVSEMHHMNSLQDKSLAAMMAPLSQQYRKGSVSQFPAAGDGSQFVPVRASYHLPTEEEKAKARLEQEEQAAAYEVKDNLLCTNVNEEKCAKEYANKGCEVNIGYTMFHCPKKCGFCSAGGDELCIDFYLNKCPKLAAEGKCTDDSKASWMEENCRQSCQLCM